MYLSPVRHRGTAATAPGWRVVTATTAAEVAEHQQQWEDLALALGRPFSAPGWALAWFRHLGPARGLLRIMFVFDGDELCGVLPLFTAARALPGARRYRVLGNGDALQLEPLAVPGSEIAVAAALATGLTQIRPVVRVLSLDGIPSDSPWPQLLTRAWAASGGAAGIVVTRTEGVPVVRLGDGGFDEWFRDRSSSYRKRVRHAQRALEAAGGSCVTVAPDELPAAVTDVVRLHEQRWRGRGGSRMMSAGLRSLLRELAERPETVPSFRVVVLRVGDRTVGGGAHLTTGSRQYAWFHGFDADAARFSPGHLLLTEVIRQASEGDARTIDLGHGSQEYKKTVANAGETIEWVSLVAPGVGRTYRRLLLLPAWARPRLSRALPEQAAVHVRRALNLAVALRGRGSRG